MPASSRTRNAPNAASRWSSASCSALMTLLLYAEFGKLRQALLILGIVPLAALGGLMALFITGETLNIATAVGLHRAVRRRGAERHHHGLEPQSRARDRRCAARGDPDGRRRAFPAGADDGDGRHHRHAAGGARDRCRQRRPARRGDRHHRRHDPRDLAHAAGASRASITRSSGSPSAGRRRPSRRRWSPRSNMRLAAWSR